MHVSVAIVGFRNPADITTCLAALSGSEHSDFDVVICENGGDAAFRELEAAVPARLPGGQAVTLVNAGRNLGYAGGVNRAMAAAPDADAWWVLNPDTEPEPRALAEAVARLARGDCDAVGSTIVLPDETVQSHGGQWQGWLGRAVSMGHGTRADAAVDPDGVERGQDYLNGAAMLIGRRFLEGVGPMREDYFLYCEETEWFLRPSARGRRLGFAPASRVRHHAGTTTGSYAPIRGRPKTPVYLNERNRLLVTRDCFPGRLAIVAPAALAVLLFRYGRKGAWRQVGYALAGWAAGLGNRRGPPRWIPGFTGSGMGAA